MPVDTEEQPQRHWHETTHRSSVGSEPTRIALMIPKSSHPATIEIHDNDYSVHSPACSVSTVMLELVG